MDLNGFLSASIYFMAKRDIKKFRVCLNKAASHCLLGTGSLTELDWFPNIGDHEVLSFLTIQKQLAEGERFEASYQTTRSKIHGKLTKLEN